MDLMREILAGEKVTANHPPRQADGTCTKYLTLIALNFFCSLWLFIHEFLHYMPISDTIILKISNAATNDYFYHRLICLFVFTVNRLIYEKSKYYQKMK